MKREVRRLPSLDATSVEGTVVRVTGRVKVLTTSLVGPGTGRTCVAHRTRVFLAQVGLDSFARTPDVFVEMCSFALEVERIGVVVVDGEGARVEVGLRDARPLDVVGLDERVKRFRERYGLPRLRMSLVTSPATFDLLLVSWHNVPTAGGPYAPPTPTTDYTIVYASGFHPDLPPIAIVDAQLAGQAVAHGQTLIPQAQTYSDKYCVYLEQVQLMLSPL